MHSFTLCFINVLKTINSLDMVTIPSLNLKLYWLLADQGFQTVKNMIHNVNRNYILQVIPATRKLAIRNFAYTKSIFTTHFSIYKTLKFRVMKFWIAWPAPQHRPSTPEMHSSQSNSYINSFCQLSAYSQQVFSCLHQFLTVSSMHYWIINL